VDRKQIIALVIPVCYFAVSWLFPWEKYQWESSISVSYIFDGIFIILAGLILRKVPSYQIENIKRIPGKLVAILGLAALSIFLNNLFAFQAPFRFVDQLAIQLLVMAPLVEELVFRFGFFHIFEKVGFTQKWQLNINSLLFSISHLPAMWVVPVEFRTFIGYQMVYTFALGWVCTKAMIRHKSLLVPIIMHFLFNLLFYIGVKQSWL
jgi:membrane protease YdiL (CAAX protease family)